MLHLPAVQSSLRVPHDVADDPHPTAHPASWPADGGSGFHAVSASAAVIAL